jgi:hypothetical protein
MNAEHFTRILRIILHRCLFLYIHFFGLIVLTPLEPSTSLTPHYVVTHSLCRWTLVRSTTSSVSCELKNQSLVNTRIPRYPLAVSPWYGSLAIRWTLAVPPWKYSIAIRSVSPCDGSLAIRSLLRRGKTPSPSAVSGWEDPITLRSLAIAVGQIHMGKLSRYPLVDCCIVVLSLCLRKGTNREENSVGRLCSPSLSSNWGRRLARNASRRPPVC